MGGVMPTGERGMADLWLGVGCHWQGPRWMFCLLKQGYKNLGEPARRGEALWLCLKHEEGRLGNVQVQALTSAACVAHKKHWKLRWTVG